MESRARPEPDLDLGLPGHKALFPFPGIPVCLSCPVLVSHGRTLPPCLNFACLDITYLIHTAAPMASFPPFSLSFLHNIVPVRFAIGSPPPPPSIYYPSRPPMSLSEGFISGWVPSYGDDDDNVDMRNFAYPIKVPHDFLSSSPTLTRTSSDDSHSYYQRASSLSFEQSPPSPGSSVDHTDGSYADPSPGPSLSSSDRRAIRNRMRDPDWVPRPRNAFIIFRCEYSRTHARDPSDPSDKSNRSDKTLSKRAGEEWRRLSAADREQYKILAEQEKAAHAVQNPDYRFKPVRRPPPGTASSATRGRLGSFRRTDRSAQVASLIMRSERGASSWTQDDDQEHMAHPEPAAIQASSSTGVIGRRRSASMPQPVAPPRAVVIPNKARIPAPISCMSSPGPTSLDVDVLSTSEMDDSPLYTPVSPIPPALHTQPSGFQMQPLPEHPLPLPLNEVFDCSMDIGGTQVRASVLLTRNSCPRPTQQNSSAPIGATSGVFAYSDSSFDQHQRFTFADGDVYPTSPELTTPYADWVCTAAPTESSLAIAGATAALPKSPDTGVVGSFGPTTHLPIPFTLQHTTSALNEIPTAQSWGVGYSQPANGAAVYGGTPDLAAVFAEALPAGYDVAGAQVGLDEFINAL